ncbi:hypothetical protein AB1N83_007307 [Pleurotus pulmonarius]
MGLRHYDEGSGIVTTYTSYIEGIQVKLNDRCPGATISLYYRDIEALGERELLYSKIDCSKELLWTPPTPEFLRNGVEMEYWADAHMRYEIITTPEEVDEIASRAEYDGQDVAHIAVTRTLSVGTSTVWLTVARNRNYDSPSHLDVRFCVEFGNSEDCTRFLNEHVRMLEDPYIRVRARGITVIDHIMHSLTQISGDYLSADDIAAHHGLTITISAREISFSTGTDSVSLGNGFTVSTPINGGNIGGRNNINNNCFSMQTDQAASIWKAVPSEPAPGRKGISTLVHRFARLIRFGPPRAADNKLHRSR